MVDQSKSSANTALCLMTMLVTASTTQAQISNAPQRYRSQLDNNNLEEFGRTQRQYTNGQQQHRRPEKKVRKLEDDADSELDMSMPLGPSVRMMSIPLQELRLDLSMPMNEQSNLEIVILGGDSDSDESTPLLASFLAGISALFIGSVALLAKMKQTKPGPREVDVRESQQEMDDMERREDTYSPKSFSADMQGRMVSFTGWDDNDTEGDMRDINII